MTEATTTLTRAGESECQRCACTQTPSFVTQELSGAPGVYSAEEARQLSARTSVLRRGALAAAPVPAGQQVSIWRLYDTAAVIVPVLRREDEMRAWSIERDRQQRQNREE